MNMKMHRKRSLFRRFGSRRTAVCLAALAAVPALDGGPAHALSFVFINNGATAAMQTGFQQAADRWSANFTNPVTVRITISSANLGSNVLGSTSNNPIAYSYSLIKASLVNGAVSADDTTSIAAVAGTASSFPMFMNHTAENGNSATPYLDTGNEANNISLNVTRANARALGQIANTNTASDASITFSTQFTFDYDTRNGTSGTDFVGVATHEIGHALGFVSGVDYLDAFQGTGLSAASYKAMPADLFRYSTGVGGSIATGGTGTMDFTASNTQKNFSVDGGVTPSVQFARGANFGDGAQASHWKDNMGIGIMDPSASSGETLAISQNDLRLFDVIGWTRDNTWEWAYSGGGSWNLPLNWNTDSVPTSAQDGVFQLGLTYAANITFTLSGSVRDLINRKDTLTLAPDVALSLTVARNFIVGDTAGTSATLTFLTGTLNTPTTQIGTVATSTGTFNFSSGAWTNTGSVYVGGSDTAAAGTGVLNRTSSGAFVVGGTLKVWGAGTVNASSGASTIGTLDVSSGGQVNVSSGTMNVTTTVNNGAIVRTGGTVSLGTVDGTGSLTLSGNGATTALRVRQDSLSVTSNAQLVIPASGSSTFTSVVKSLNLGGESPTGKIDLNNNFLIVNYTGAVGTNLSDASAAISAGRGSTTGPGVHLYNGLGLISTTALTANQAAGFDKFSLGAINNADLNAFNGANSAYTTFGGQNVDADSVLVRYTYSGDANLDGIISAADFSLINRGFAGTIPNVGWLSGDFTLDGLIDADDFAVIDFGFLKQGGQLDVGEPVAVPEPAGLAVLALGATSLLRRSRRAK